MTVANTMCPVSGKEIDRENPPATTQYDGRTVGFCCDNCKASFNEDPSSYEDNLEGEVEPEEEDTKSCEAVFSEAIEDLTDDDE